MARIFLASLMTLHGLIHLIGFSKEWKLGPINMLKGNTLFTFSEKTAKIIGIIWLFVCILFLEAVYLYLSANQWNWILTFIAIGFSQLLIILYWQDAKFGTIANVIILAILFQNMMSLQYTNNVDSEIQHIVSASQPITVNGKESNNEIPKIVQQWMKTSQDGRKKLNYIKLTQKGSMKTQRDSKWMPYTAEQYYTFNPPAFLWNAQIKANSFMTIQGRDKYENGNGNMLIKLLSVYTIANSSGDEIDQGTLLRFMGEMIWFPEIASSEYLQWKQIDQNVATATLLYKGVSASGDFTFSNEGHVEKFTAYRYGEFDGTFSKELWEVEIIEYGNIRGRKVPIKCAVTWKLDGGDFTWLNLEVTDIEYHAF